MSCTSSASISRGSCLTMVYNTRFFMREHSKMNSAVIILAIVACATAANIPARPVHPVFANWNRDAKIVGGSEVTPNSVPYQVALFLGDYFCGGSLISTKWVLTAAHCGELTNTPQVILGAHNIRKTESTQVVVNGKKPIIHPNWNSNTLQNDISLIELPQAVTLNNNIKTVPLAATNAGNYAGDTATATGWGLPSDSASSISDVLRTVSSTIMTNAACQQKFGAGIPVYDSIVCLDGSKGKSTCSGDSGGPLTVNGVQIGLTSYGISLGCEVGYPAAFSRISSFRSFITQQTGV